MQSTASVHGNHKIHSKMSSASKSQASVSTEQKTPNHPCAICYNYTASCARRSPGKIEHPLPRLGSLRFQPSTYLFFFQGMSWVTEGPAERLARQQNQGNCGSSANSRASESKSGPCLDLMRLDQTWNVVRICRSENVLSQTFRSCASTERNHREFHSNSGPFQ